MFLLLGAIVAGLGGGCATVSYRVPGVEVQRLANLPPQERGTDVRVVSASAPLYPSTEQPPPPVAAAPPAAPVYAPDVVVVEASPPPVVVEPNVYVGVEVPVGARPPPPVVWPPAGPRFVGTPPAASGWHGSPVTSAPRVSAPTTSGWRGSPVASAPRAPASSHPSVPSRSGGHVRGGGGHGGGGSDAVAAIGAAVIVVGLVAIAAEAAAEADRARNFDGWVSVDPWHPLVLHYGNNYKRKIPLSMLQPTDTIGLQYAVLLPADGPVQMKRPAPPPSPVAAPPTN